MKLYTCFPACGCTRTERDAKSKNMLEHRSDGELMGGPSQMELDSFPCNISHVWLPAVSNLPSLHGFGADLALKCALPNDVITPVISCHQTSN